MTPSEIDILFSWISSQMELLFASSFLKLVRMGLELFSSPISQRCVGDLLCRGCVYLPAHHDYRPDAETCLAHHDLLHLHFRAGLWCHRRFFLSPRGAPAWRISWWWTRGGGSYHPHLG